MAASTESNIKLATLLRECATYVELNEFHPSIYKALGGLHEYAAKANIPSEVPSVQSLLPPPPTTTATTTATTDRKSTRLNSSHITPSRMPSSA